MPTCYQYLVVFSSDSKQEVAELEAKGNALGLGPLKSVHDIFRPNSRSQSKTFQKRHYGYRLFLEMRPRDTIVFPSFGRAFSGLGDFSKNLKRWVTAGIRVIVIDLGIDSEAAFGRDWIAVFLAMTAKARRSRAEAVQRENKRKDSTGRAILGLRRKGARGRRYLVVDPTMYELGMKCGEWVDQGWTYDQIETHLWKTRIFRVLRFAPRALAVEDLRDPSFARKWTASAVRCLVRNIEKINQGVLAGVYELPRTWRPMAGPLMSIPFQQSAHSLRKGSPQAERHWNQAKAIGRRVRKLRKEQGLTQKAFGILCGGIAQSQIADIERGEHHPQSATLMKFANALGVPVESFDCRPAVPV